MTYFPKILTFFSILIVLTSCTSAQFGSRRKSKDKDQGNAANGGANQGNDSGGNASGGNASGGNASAGNASSGNENDEEEKPTIPIKEGCKDSDFILPEWPQTIAACVNEGKIYNFDKSACSAIPRAHFACNWSNILDEEDRVMRGITPDPRIGSVNRKTWSKIVGCGEHSDADYHILVLQYWTPNSEKDVEKCEMAAGWGIHTSCRIYKKKKGLPDISWQNCLDYAP